MWTSFRTSKSDLISSVSLRLSLFQGKIYMYGGKIDSTGNVSSQLWVFHIQNQTWVLLSPRVKDQYAVVGHSAHIVTPLQDAEGDGPVMLVMFGHCPLYGYISQVQEYNIGGSEPRRHCVLEKTHTFIY
ncbi:Attractin [Liparis tanakae]|uniref:Attractin n=1 Tax=Liparis tanakae TaxID=230148 RepID=A0A4Z2E7T4_9TELE|nr:Attractin [Liparis tanakae]